jgi:hypothetical protein
MAHAFFLGVDATPSDAANSFDVTFALFEKSREGDDDAVQYRLDHIRHRTEVASAEDLAEHLQGVVADRPYIGRTSFIVNRRTAFGQALVDALRERGLDPVAATLTEGTGVTAGETDEIAVHLGGIDAVRTIADRHRDGVLTMEGHPTEVGSQLARDVRDLAERLDAADGDSEALEGTTSGPSFDPAATHVTSAALAVWLGTERSFDPSQHLKESPRPGSPDGPGA